MPPEANIVESASSDVTPVQQPVAPREEPPKKTEVDVEALRRELEEAKKQLSEYSKQVSELSEAKKQWESERERLARYDQWFESTVAPYWDSPEDFQRDLVQKLISTRGQNGQQQRGAPRTTYSQGRPTVQRQPMVQSGAQPQMTAQQVADLIEGLADDELITAGQARRALAKLQQGRLTQADVQRLVAAREKQFSDQLYRWLTQQFQDFQRHLYSEALPKAFSIYDSTAALRAAHKDDPEFDINKVIKVMTEKGISDPNAAYKEVYGERDMQRAIEKAKEEAKKQAREELEREFQAKNVSVLSGGGGFFPPTHEEEPPPKNIDEAMERAAKEITEKYGQRIWMNP